LALRIHTRALSASAIRPIKLVRDLAIPLSHHPSLRLLHGKIRPGNVEMTVARPAFAALIPEPSWHERILGLKQTVRVVAGHQRYLDDPPHLTVFLAIFPDLDAIVPHLNRCCDSLPPVTAEIEGWHVFRNDPLTNGHTVVCSIASTSQDMLRRLQKQVITAIAPLRDPVASRSRYTASWQQLSPVRQNSVSLHGFPFTGDDWQPHVSICSVAPPHWDAAWAALSPAEPRGIMRFSALHWYELIDGVPQLHTKIPLR
jgi:hypothetical protein